MQTATSTACDGHMICFVQTPASTSSGTAGENQSFLERWLPGWSSGYMEGEDTTDGGESQPGWTPHVQKQQSMREGWF